MQQRRKADAEAVRWLQAHWKSIVGKEQVFRGNTMRRGNCQVVMNGTPLLGLCDSRLREAPTHRCTLLWQHVASVLLELVPASWPLAALAAQRNLNLHRISGQVGARRPRGRHGQWGG